MADRTARSLPRAWIGLGAVLLLFVAVTADAAHGLASVSGRLDEIARINNQQQRCAVQMREHVDQVAAGTRDLVLENDVTLMRALADHIASESTAYDDAEATLGALLAGSDYTSQKENALFARSAADKAVAWPVLTRVIALGSDNEDAAATTLFMSQAKPALARWRDTLSELADVEEQQNLAAAADAQATYRRSLAILGVLCAVALVVSGLAALAIARGPAAGGANQ